MYSTAVELWQALTKMAGLDPGAGSPEDGSYDGSLVADLRDRLFPGQTENLDKLIRTSDPPVSTTVFIRAFFQTLRPFSMMMRQILEMLSAASARGSGEALLIRFDFDPDKGPLDLLLKQFAAAVEVVERALVEVAVAPLDYQVIWKLGRVCEDVIPPYGGGAEALKLDSEDLRRWFAAYKNNGRFDLFPPLPSTGHERFDAHVNALIQLINQMLAAFRRYGADRRALREAADADDLRDVKDPTGFTVRQLWVIESDYWPSAMAGWIIAARGTLRTTTEPAALAERVVRRIDEIWPAEGKVDEVEMLIPHIEEMLNLPVWKKRHEVYAVWMGSQIWKALEGEWEFKFHVCDGRLSFSFSGIHLATLFHRTSGDIWLWWTELRSAAKNLPSGHRAGAIQPDYRLQAAPLSASNVDRLIVEVKQYKKSGNANFSAALDDYAAACPQAIVIVANYGPVSERVIGSLTPEYQARAAALGHVRPDRSDQLQRLYRLIRLGCDPTLRNSAGASLLFQAKDVVLSWTQTGVDLDLHLFRADTSVDHLWFRQRFLPDDAVTLSEDIRSVPGTERATFAGSKGRYLVCVHHYEGGSIPQEGSAPLIVGLQTPTSDVERAFSSGPFQAGSWWIVCWLDTATGGVEVVDEKVSNAEDWLKAHA